MYGSSAEPFQNKLKVKSSKKCFNRNKKRDPEVHKGPVSELLLKDPDNCLVHSAKLSAVLCSGRQKSDQLENITTFIENIKVDDSMVSCF